MKKELELKEPSYPFNEKEEYIKDGMVYCKKCHERLDKNLIEFLGSKIFSRDCKCKRDEREAYEKRQRQEEIRRLKSDCFPSPIQWHYTFDKFKGDPTKPYIIAKNFAKEFSQMKKENIGLLFYGSVGSDKSYLASAIANYLIEEERIRVLIKNFAEIINDIQKREANKIYGFSAKETLDLAQKLYERKLISYPRTDSRYLTLDMKEKVDKYLFMLKSDLEIDEENFLSIFDSKKVSDHYAIIPTEATLDFDFKKLSEDEKKIYRLIEAKLLMSASKSLVESMTKVIYVYDGMEFTANGKTIIVEGFKQFDLSQKKNEKVLPVIKKGDVYDVKETLINEKYTQPPKAYTEDSLLKAMEIAGNKALDKEVEVERKGIGTPATRAGIIENLIYKRFLERDKKNLISTHKGVSLVAIVGEEFKSAETTANWEMKLSDIAKGNLSKEEFLSEIEGEIKNSINKYKNKIDD